jgi:hypothetical protein
VLDPAIVAPHVCVAIADGCHGPGQGGGVTRTFANTACRYVGADTALLPPNSNLYFGPSLTLAGSPYVNAAFPGKGCGPDRRTPCPQPPGGRDRVRRRRDSHDGPD